MKPYVKDNKVGVGKFKADENPQCNERIQHSTKYDRLVCRNANRGRKKALRRSIKLWIYKIVSKSVDE